jgi:hypothetical protein
VATGTHRGNPEEVITFEDFHGTGRPAGPLPGGYASFTWCKNAWFMTSKFCGSLHGGCRAVLFNANGEDIIFERDRLFSLKDMSLSLIWAQAADVLIEGWEGATRRYIESVKVSRTALARPHLHFMDIDRVWLTSGGVHVAIYSITVVFQNT